MALSVRETLVRLVRENRAEKKKGENYFRPTGAGGGGLGNPFSDGYRSPDPWNDRYPRETYRPPDGNGDRGTPTTQDTVGRAVATMIVGGASTGGGSPGTGITHV